MFKSIKNLAGALSDITSDVIDVTVESVGIVSDCTNHAVEGMKTLRKEIQNADFSDTNEEVTEAEKESDLEVKLK